MSIASLKVVTLTAEKTPGREKIVLFLISFVAWMHHVAADSI